MEQSYHSLSPARRWSPGMADGDPGLWWPEERCPVLRHPAARGSSAAVRRAIRVGHAYTFNLFTEHLENWPVMWICQRIGIRQLLPALPAMMRRDAKIMATEEAHHEVFSGDLIDRMEAATGLPRLETLPAFKARLAQLLAEAGPDQGWLVMAAFVIGSETLITGSLGGLAKDTRLKVVVRAVMHDHNVDELRHRSFFTQLCAILARRLREEHLERFALLLPRVMASYLRPDRAALAAVARGAGLPDPRRIAGDLAAAPSVMEGMAAAAAPSIRAFERFGLLELPGVEAGFAREGLLR